MCIRDSCGRPPGPSGLFQPSLQSFCRLGHDFFFFFAGGAARGATRPPKQSGVIPAYQSPTGVPAGSASLPRSIQVLCYHLRRSIFFFPSVCFPPSVGAAHTKHWNLPCAHQPCRQLRAGRAASCPQPIYPRGPSIPFAILLLLSTRRSLSPVCRLPLLFFPFTSTHRYSSPTNLLLSDSLFINHGSTLLRCISLPRPPRQRSITFCRFWGPPCKQQTPTTQVTACYAPTRRKQIPSCPPPQPPTESLNSVYAEPNPPPARSSRHSLVILRSGSTSFYSSPRPFARPFLQSSHDNTPSLYLGI